ncbi:MAG: TetR/AcrR family transcriptional regulator [Pseudomonadota bacterium]
MRKQPRQQRSQTMVDAIVEAGFVSLARHGLEGTTTRHIADIAGISVGSLYQYFPDKEAIYTAMQQRVVSELIVFLRDMTPLMLDSDVRTGVTLLLNRFREWVQRGDGRYLAYIRYAMQFDFGAQEMNRLESALMDLVMQYLLRYPELARLPNIAGVAWFLINGGVFAMIRFLSTPNPRITFEQFVDALATLITSSIEQGMRGNP